jgi:hypothetical protein
MSVHSGDVLMWPGYISVNVQPCVMLLDNTSLQKNLFSAVKTKIGGFY